MALISLCESRGWFMASDQSSHDATHYSMDGRNGGMIKVPVEAITEFNTVLFGDIDNGTPVFIIEKRRGDFASLVFDIDFGEMDIQIQDALSFGEKIIKHVFTIFEYEPNSGPDMHHVAAVSTCKSSPNMHITFPYYGLSQKDCVQIICMITSIMYQERQGLVLALANSNLTAFEKIIDISVALSNGIRMNGCRKKYKCKDCISRSNGSWCGRCLFGVDVSVGPKVYNTTHFMKLGKSVLSKIPMNMQPMTKWTLSHLNNYRAKPGKIRTPAGIYVSCMQACSQRLSHALSNLTLIQQRRSGMKKNPDLILGSHNIDIISKACVTDLGYPARPILKHVVIPSLPQERRQHETAAAEKVYLSILFDNNDPSSRYCANIGERHKSAQSFIVLDCNEGLLSQRCFCNCPASPDKIKCSNFSSQAIKLVNLDVATIIENVSKTGYEKTDTQTPKKTPTQTELPSPKLIPPALTLTPILTPVITNKDKRKSDVINEMIVSSPKTRRRLGANKTQKGFPTNINSLELRTYAFTDSISVRVYVPTMHPDFKKNQNSTHELVRIGIMRIIEGVLPERSLVASHAANELFEDELVGEYVSENDDM